MVKKQDGTQVKMTLDEFKVYQQTLKHLSTKALEHNDQPLNQPAKEVAKSDDVPKGKMAIVEKKEIKQKKEELPMVLGTEAVTTVSPVKDVFVDEAKYVRNSKTAKNTKVNEKNIVEKEVKKPISLAKDDFVSLLEEDEEDVPKPQGQAVTMSSYDDVVKKIITESGVRVPADLKERLSSLILSYIKQVRDEYQFIDYADRPAQRGGVGLSKDDASKLLSMIKKTNTQPAKRSLEIVTDSIVTKPAQKSLNVITDSTSVRSIERSQKIITDSAIDKPIDIVQPRNVVHDIVSIPPEQKTVGPEGEMSTFGLSDFRRLARDPAKARDMLFSKIQGWKAESFLLYMKAAQAWHKSPLYREYLDLTENSLKENTQISQLLIEQTKAGGMTFGEYKEIVELNRQLSN